MEEIYILAVHRPEKNSTPMVIVPFEFGYSYGMLQNTLKLHGYFLNDKKLKILINDGLVPCHENGKEQWLMLFKTPMNQAIEWPPEPKLHGSLVSGPHDEYVFNGSQPMLANDHNFGKGTIYSGNHKIGEVSELKFELTTPPPPYEGAL